MQNESKIPQTSENNFEFQKQLKQAIDTKTKPLGSLGRLEELAFRIGCIQNTLNPKFVQPTILVFAGDHGIAEEGVSAYPREVTYQMVMNFLNGGAAINAFAKTHGLELKIIDSGVACDFPGELSPLPAKIGYGTKSFLKEKAMSSNELERSFHKASEIVENLSQENCNIVGFGEMGIGNTSSASLIMSSICQLPLSECVGRGTGLGDEQLKAKLEILQNAQNFHGQLNDPKTILQTYGGFEIAMITGAMLEAFQKNMILLVDGFIATSAFLVAHALQPGIMKNAIFSHKSQESGHRKMLEYLDAEPVLDLDMRLGEGTGCAVVFPILESAIAFLNDMASFDSAGVSRS